MIHFTVLMWNARDANKSRLAGPLLPFAELWGLDSFLVPNYFDRTKLYMIVVTQMLPSTRYGYHARLETSQSCLRQHRFFIFSEQLAERTTSSNSSFCTLNDSGKHKRVCELFNLPMLHLALAHHGIHMTNETQITISILAKTAGL